MAVFMLVILGLSVLLATGTVFVVVVGKALEDRLALQDRERTQEVVRRHRQRYARTIGYNDCPPYPTDSELTPDERDEALIQDGS